MAYHIKKTSAMNADVSVFYVKKHHWSDDYSDRKTWSSRTTPTNLMKNTDGTNGGWQGASVVEE